jgi:hypothetical protein
MTIKSQRDGMRESHAAHPDDEWGAVMAFAVLLRTGEVRWVRNSRGMTDVDYSHRVWHDGVQKGWLM